MIEEVVNIILRVLIDEDGEASYKEILGGSGCTDKEVRDALVYLTDSELVKREDDTYTLVKRLRAMQIAKAAQFGIDVTDYEFYFEMTDKDKEEALTFSKKSENVKKLELVKRKALILKRNYLITEKIDGVHENLMVIFETTNSMLYEYLEKKAETDEQLKVLLEMHAKAENSLRAYVENNLK